MAAITHVGENKGVKKTTWYSIGYFTLGLILLGSGIYSLINPGVSLISFGIVFSVVLFIQGIMEMTLVLSGAQSQGSAGWLAISALISLMLGSYLMFYPVESAMVMSYTLVFVLMFKSMEALGRAFDLGKISKSTAWLVGILGFLGLMISFNLLTYPALGAEFSVIWIATGIMIWGLYLMAGAGSLAKVKSIKDSIKEIL